MASPTASPAPARKNAPGAARLLGEFLRARRDHLSPQDVGLPCGARRRAAGLRREEVAALCGISPTWYTWIEQGRTHAVSADTLAALAQGLRLSQAERSYLFELAARADPVPRVSDLNDQGELAALVDAVRTPAYVLDGHWDAVAWNKPARALFDAWLGTRGGDRNLLRYVFLHAQAPQFIVGWADRAQRLVAEYRADTAQRRDDPAGKSLVEELRRASPAFRDAWQSQRVLSREGGLRAFDHPRSGRRHYQQFTLRVAHHGELKLTILVPSDAIEGSADA